MTIWSKEESFRSGIIAIASRVALRGLAGVTATRLVTKASNSLRVAGNRTVTFYDIQGNWFSRDDGSSAPIDGAGHMNGDIFHFYIDGLVYNGVATNVSADAYFDIVKGNGHMHLKETVGASEQFYVTFQKTPCSNIRVPY